MAWLTDSSDLDEPTAEDVKANAAADEDEAGSDVATAGDCIVWREATGSFDRADPVVAFALLLSPLLLLLVLVLLLLSSLCLDPLGSREWSGMIQRSRWSGRMDGCWMDVMCL